MKSTKLSVFLIALFIFTVTGTVNSQTCSASIQSTATVQTSNGTISGSEKTYWICHGLTVTVNSFDSEIYAESGCTLIISGDQNIVIMKGSGSATIDGDMCQVFHDPSVNITNNNSPSSSSFACTTGVSFNYANAPSSGCPSVGVEKISELPEAFIYPVPANEVLVVHFNTPQKAFPIKYEIYSSLGEIGLTGFINSEKTEISLTNLPDGVYFLMLNEPSGNPQVQKFVIAHDQH